MKKYFWFMLLSSALGTACGNKPNPSNPTSAPTATTPAAQTNAVQNSFCGCPAVKALVEKGKSNQLNTADEKSKALNDYMSGLEVCNKTFNDKIAGLDDAGKAQKIIEFEAEMAAQCPELQNEVKAIIAKLQ